MPCGTQWSCRRGGGLHVAFPGLCAGGRADSPALNGTWRSVGLQLLNSFVEASPSLGGDSFKWGVEQNHAVRLRGAGQFSYSRGPFPKCSKHAEMCIPLTLHSSLGVSADTFAACVVPRPWWGCFLSVLVAPAVACLGLLVLRVSSFTHRAQGRRSEMLIQCKYAGLEQLFSEARAARKLESPQRGLYLHARSSQLALGVLPQGRTLQRPLLLLFQKQMQQGRCEFLDSGRVSLLTGLSSSSHLAEKLLCCRAQPAWAGPR